MTARRRVKRVDKTTYRLDKIDYELDRMATETPTISGATLRQRLKAIKEKMEVIINDSQGQEDRHDQ